MERLTCSLVTTFAWLTAAALVLVAVMAALATRVTSWERTARVAVVVAEALVVLYVVAELGLLLRADAADRPDSMLTHIGYAVAAVGLIPALAWRPPTDPNAEAEPEPVSLWVLVVVLLAVAVCVIRLVQTR